MQLIVTGTTGGIGSSVVRKALQSPAVEKVYCLHRKKEKFQNLIQSLFAQEYACSKIVPVRQEASASDGMRTLLQKLHDSPIENMACVHTAFCLEPLLRAGTYAPEDIRQNVTANVTDMVFLINGLLELHHAKNIELKIIHMDSGAADKPIEGWGLYCAAKAYANMFLKTVQLENPQVKIVSYEPGVVDTPMQEKIRQTDDAVCSQAGTFRAYYEKGMLRPADEIAGDIIARFVENWDAQNFRERFQPR